MDKFDKAVDDIKKMRVQGATSVAKSGVAAVRDSNHKLDEDIAIMKKARCTEPMLFNCLSFIEKGGKRVADDILRIINEGGRKIVDNGAEILKDGMKILTYCHSSTVVSVVRKGVEKGLKIEVVCCETRPRYQGRITAKELGGMGVKTRLVVDGAGGYYLDNEKFDGVFLGVDALTRDSFYNKIGSYGISLASFENGVDVYVFGSLLKYTDRKVEIEKRDKSEVWEESPSGVAVENLAFDRVSYKYIKGVVSEFGVIKPEEVEKTAKENYCFIE